MGTGEAKAARGESGCAPRAWGTEAHCPAAGDQEEAKAGKTEGEGVQEEPTPGHDTEAEENEGVHAGIMNGPGATFVGPRGNDVPVIGVGEGSSGCSGLDTNTGTGSGGGGSEVEEEVPSLVKVGKKLPGA